MGGTVNVRRVVDLNVGSASYDVAEPPVLIGDRAIPRIIEVVFPGVEGQPKLDMTIDSSDGVPRCRVVRIESVEKGREIRTKDFRAIAIDDWIESIVSACSDELVVHEDGTTSVELRSHKSDVDLRETVSQLRTARRADRRIVNDELLRKVAETYRAQDRHAVDAVAVAFGCSYRTAARYVREARNRGFLEEKGEADD
jgi:hypothetical protein